MTDWKLKGLQMYGKFFPMDVFLRLGLCIAGELGHGLGKDRINYPVISWH